MSTVEIESPGGIVPAYLARPEGVGPWPAVVVVHDALGMTADLRRQADWLADHGYLAVAPDLYHRGRRIPCMIATLRSLSSGQGRVFEDLVATRAHVRVLPECSGRLGIIGFCMGGNIALALAASGDYDASSVNYGDIGAQRLDSLAGACPVVGSYGGRDRSLRSAPARLEAALSGFGVDHDIEVYPTAGHGFLNDHGGEMPRWALVAGWYARTGYDPTAAADARRRILEFFDRHLRD